MSFTKRVYPSRRKVYIYGSGGVLALLTFIQIYLASYGFDVSDWNGNPFPESLICAGNPQERCLWNISIVSSNYSLIFSNKLNIYTNAEDNDNITVIVRKKDSLGRLRVFNMTGKTLKNDSRWDLQVEIIKPIDKTVKWGINSEGVINSEVLDPIAKGYSKASFMPILTRNEVFFDHGEGEFPVVNPLSYNMTISEKYFGFFFNNVKGYLTKFEVWVGTEKNMTYNETTQVWIPNITTMQIISSNGTYNQTQDNGYFNKTTTQKTGTETVYSLLNATQTYTLRPKEQAKILIKGYWDVKTAYKTGIAIDWFPNLSVSSVSYIRDDWAWWNVSYGYKRQQPISAPVTEKVTMPCMINGTTGFNLGSPSRTYTTWVPCEYNSTDEYLYYQNSSVWAYVNETSSTQLKHDTEVNTSDLIAWWSFDDSSQNTVIDDLGKTDMPCVVGTCTNIAGKIGNARNFTGGNTVAGDVYQGTMQIFNSTKPFIVSAWLYPTENNTQSNAYNIIAKVTTGTPEVLMNINNNGAGTLACSNGATFVYTTTPTTLNTWHYAACVYNGTHMFTYLDGTLTAGTSMTVANAINTMTFGAYRYTGANQGGYKGILDDVRIYQRALSTTELSDLYGINGTSLYQKDNNATGLWDSVSGLKGRWDLDVDALDSTSNNNDGTITGATYTASGKYAGAYDFDGADDRIQMADSATLEPANVTVEAWIYRKRDSGGIEVIVASTGSDASSVGRGYKLWIGSGDKASIVKGNGTAPYYAGQTCAGTTNIALNSWYHLVGIYNGTGMEIWVNGTKENSCAISGGIGYTNVDRTVIGSEWDDIDGYYWEFNGSIDEVRIYTRALSSNEVIADYNAGNQALGSQIQNCFVAGNPCGLVNTIYLNGTSANRYYELGDQINITATVNDTGGLGSLCLTIDHPDFGTNFTCGINGTIPTDYFTSIIPALNTFNDSSTSQNHTGNNVTGYVIFNSADSISNGQMNLRGYNTTWGYRENADSGVSGITCQNSWDNTAPCINAYDGDWDTFGYGNSTTFARLYRVYNLTGKGTSAANLTIKYRDTPITTTITIPTNCINPPSYPESIVLQIYTGYVGVTPTVYVFCYVSPSWTTILSDSFAGTYPYLYEEAISYNTTAINYPTNLSIDIGNDGNLDYWMPYSTLQDVYGITNVFKTNVATKNLTFSNAGRNISYIDIPCNIQANSMSLNISGGNGSKVSNTVDSVTAKSFTFSTANSPQLFTLQVPKSSTLDANATIKINGSVYYNSNGSLSGGYTSPDWNHNGYQWTQSSKAYDGTNIYLYGASVSGAVSCNPTITLSLVGDSGIKASCSGVGSGCYAGWYYSCYVSVSSKQPAENVWVTTNGPGGCAASSGSGTPCATYFSGLNQYDTPSPTNVTIYFNTTNQYLEYNYALELNSSVGDKTVTLRKDNMQNYLNGCTTTTCNVPYYINSVNTKGTVSIHDVNVTYTNSISNVTLDIGSDGTIDSTITGNTIPNNNMTMGTSGINAINTYMSGTCLNRSLPLLWSSATAGTLSSYALVLNYSINPISLNTTAMNNYLINKTGNVHIPIKYTADNWGILNTNTLNIPFYGDVNYTVTANYTDGTTVASTDSKIISIVWSNYTLSYPNGVSYFQFFPKTVNSTNVTPYGQSSTTPFINITGTQRDRAFNMYVRVNASYVSTANLTVSNSSTKGTNILTTSWIKLVNNLTVGSSNGLWFWLDLFNINTTSLRYLKVYPEFESKCDLCVQ